MNPCPRPIDVNPDDDFVPVTSTVTGDTLWINRQHVLYLKRGRQDPATAVVFDSEERLAVAERPEEILG